MQNQPPPRGSLRGVRVLDFGHYLPGPILGMLLADQGADVIKIEKPLGDPGRSLPAFSTWNRGKRSVILDLKTQKGQANAQRLAASADIIIENFRPGVTERLGIGFDTLSKINHRLIYCSLPGFSAHSPYRDRQGWDPIISSATGLYQNAENTNGEPLFIPLPIVSTFGAIVGSVAVTMALIARQKTGLGQRIEVPLHSAIFTAMGTRLLRLHDYPQAPTALYRPVMMHQYQCSDGRWLQNHGVYPNFVRAFTKLIGHPSWAKSLLAQMNPSDRKALPTWRERFANIFQQKTAEEWEAGIAKAHGAGAMCRRIEEWMVHDQAIASGMVEVVEDPTLGRMKQPGIQVHLEATPGAIQGPSPRLGEHTLNVLVDDDPKSSIRAPDHATFEPVSTGVLEGLRVLDLCIVLAGPTIGRTLGEYGADVIKIDDPSRDFEVGLSTDVNRGKRSMILDLKRPEGREVFWTLFDSADIVLENYRKGSLSRLGLGYDQMQKRNPEIIYCYANAYGADGPWASRPGWEQLAQATTGMQVRRGGRNGTPILMPYPINDYGTGILGAFAVALAVHERNQTGLGQAVNTSLSMTACLFQSPYFLDYPGYVRNELEGPDARGYSALCRLYQSSDHWLFFNCANEDAWAQLTKLGSFKTLGTDPRFRGSKDRIANDKALSQLLSKTFRGKNCQHWLATLNPAGINAAKNVTVDQFRHYQDVKDAGLIVTRHHPGIGSVDHLGNTISLSKTPVRLGRPASVIGAETNDVLREAGYSKAAIERLQVTGVIKQT